MGLVPGRWPLVGRGEELALIDEQVGRGAPATVVAGDVGVGKSRLLAGWLAAREAQGRPTVVVRATRATATIPFGAFARWVPDRLADTGDRLGVLRATAARLVDQEAGPVVAVDDAHLLDDGSAALVLHLAQHTPTGLLVTIRSGEPCPDAVVALWKERLAQRIDLQPLSEPETVELVEQVLGDAVAPGTRSRLWRLTGGNPLYLREVVEAALGQGVLTRAAGDWRWEGRLAGPTRLVELVSDRIGGCDAAERRVLELVAMGEPLPVEVVLRLADREPLAELEGRGLVVVDRPSPEGAGGLVRLGHPLYSEMLRAELPAFTVQGHHQALAQAAVDAGLHDRDPLRVATWLLEGGDQPGNPELLLRASTLALLGYDHELTARLAEAAERAGGGWQATLRRAEALGPLRRWDEAEALLAGLSGEGSAPEARAAAAQVRAEQSFWHRREDLSVARAIVADAAAGLPERFRPPLLVQGARYAQIALELEESIRLATEAVAGASSLEDRLDGITCAGLAAAFLGRTSAAMATVRLVAPYTATIESAPAAVGYAAFTYSFASVVDGRIDEAASAFESILDRDRAQLGGPPRAFPAVWLARAALVQGRVRTAARLCREALGLLGDENHFGRGTSVAATLATATAQSGDAEAAAAALAWVDGRRRPAVPSDDLLTDGARAWLCAARGELSSARELAHDVARRAAGTGAWVLEVLALLDTARLGGAAAAAPRLGELADVVEGPLVVAAARFAGAAAAGDGPGLDDVAARFAAMGARLLAAEAAAVAADAHAAEGRRRDRAASLVAARRWVADCEGAVTPLLAGLARDPLATRLTGREREVAGLAARGRTSRQIAEALTISVRTVDSHLNHAYTKLGIRDRADLPAALGGADRT